VINLRYHIVSITAIFLALAIGIAVGSTFIDKATVETLRRRLDTLEQRAAETEAENDALRDRLSTFDDRQAELADEGSGQLFKGHLQDVPVVIVAARGVDPDSLDGARDAIINAGARFAGVLWATDRLRLENADDVDDLSKVLSLPSDDAERLRRSVTFRVAALLLDAASGEAVLPPDATTTTSSSTESTTTTSTEAAAEPPLLQALRGDGFLDYDPPPTSPLDGAILPDAGARFLVVGGPGAEVDDAQFLLPLLQALTSRGLAPVVAAQASVGEDADANRTVFVGPVRDDDNLSARMSTVDDLETFAGWAAVVLALENLGAGEIGHYGVGDGADRLLPAPITPP
jgi:hypothetical protein